MAANASAYWRLAGMSYIKYANVCADMVRAALKEPHRTAAKAREQVYYRSAFWKEGKMDKQGACDGNYARRQRCVSNVVGMERRETTRGAEGRKDTKTVRRMEEQTEETDVPPGFSHTAVSKPKRVAKCSERPPVEDPEQNHACTSTRSEW
eukprot:CAMPEP_0113922668 /NCGR_PEP_ID=MMETSP1159-20121227/1732_1 /TAXON_ID=88271 /ORGANISM="Picocystis salinarum" /LENGTH=150 /DNA_ID=CAMNT_0000922785 /DNA_START=27 /DNA_END=477 /DNA_ORIENTATION=+ /assembly_acc=CAM_ASM_000767